MKNIENRIRKITGNEKFKISSEEYYYPTKELLNNMLSDLSQIKIIKKQLGKKHNSLKQQFLNLIKEFCNNEKLYKLFDDDLPCLKSILDCIEENKENEIGMAKLIKWFDKWLDDLIITGNEDIFYILNEQFREFYKVNIEKEE